MLPQTFYTRGDKAIIGNTIAEFEAERSRTENGFQAVFNELHYPADLYIDPVNGVDSSAVGTKISPFKTFAGLQNSGLLPKIITQDTNIWIRPGILTERIRLDRYLLVNRLYFRPWLLSSEVAPLPWPFNLFLNYFVTPTVVGPTSGTATGGTKWRITMAGAGWLPGELRGKMYFIGAGTHWFEYGRIMDNGADWFEVAGIQSTAFDATDQFVIAEEAVSIRPLDTTSTYPLYLTENSGASFITFEAIKFEMNANPNQRYCSYFQYNECSITFAECSFIGNEAATYAGATSQYLNYSYRNPGSIDFSSCDFYFPSLKPNTTTGAFWGIGPHGWVRISNSTIIDNVQTWDGCTYFALQRCAQKYRTGMKEYNYVRAVNYYVIQSTRMDWNNVAWGYRLDGKAHFDIRNCLFENALGYGFKSYDGHGDLFDGWIEYTEVNNCSISGFDIGGNSYFGIRVLTTDPAKKNGRWGFRLRSGTQVGYLGANTLTGNLGAVNLGDDVTPVAWGVPTTDTTHLTRVAAQGA